MAIRSNDDPAVDRVKAAIRDPVDDVAVHPPDDGAMQIEVVGHPANLIGGTASPQMKVWGERW